MRVVVDEEASRDLDRIDAWISEDRPAAAASVIERILAAMEHLGQFPHIGHKGKAVGTYEWIVRGLPYIVVFEIAVDIDELRVIGVFHGAQEERRR